jgi:cytochrome oxidase assembly protein ShyY1
VSWRFARTPKWIVRHVAVLLLIATMILLLLWQVSRLHEKQDYKRLVEHRQEQPAVPVEELLPAGVHLGDDAVDDVLYRDATATGTYDDSRTVVVENRTYTDDSPGGWVLTPLDLGDGRTLLVNRGFVGLDREGKVSAPPAPAGTVRLEGLLFPSQHRGGFGAKDPVDGVLQVVARVDLARIGQQVDGDLLPAYLQVVETDPEEPATPPGVPRVRLLGPPDISEGPHLSYAVQWGIFSTIAGVGYLLLLRKVAKEEAQRLAGEAAAAGR